MIRLLTPLAVSILIGMCLVSSIAGCRSTHESDLPWNAPQSWEGSPYIPGLPGE